MRALSDLPDGSSTKVRSMALEPHIDALVFQHMHAHGFGSMSAALRDLLDRGLATTGALQGAEGTDQRARAYREAATKVEQEAREHVKAALDGWVKRRRAAAPPVKAAR